MIAAAILRRMVLRPLAATALLLRVGSWAALLRPEALVKLGLRPHLGACGGRRAVCLEMAALRARLETLWL